MLHHNLTQINLFDVPSKAQENVTLYSFDLLIDCFYLWFI